MIVPEQKVIGGMNGLLACWWDGEIMVALEEF